MLTCENDTQALAIPGALRTTRRSSTSHSGQLMRRPQNENTENQAFTDRAGILRRTHLRPHAPPPQQVRRAMARPS